jgi:F420H(2)-dependent quinone reductase
MTTQRYYNRPTFVRLRLYDPLIRSVVMHTRWRGFSRDDTVQVLAVRGRKTGRLYLHPVGVCSRAGERYIISFYGDSQWARNLRCGAEAELRDRTSAAPFVGVELAGADKLEFLRFLLDRYPMIIRVWWKLNPRKATDSDLDLLAERYPIFRVVTSPKLPG